MNLGKGYTLFIGLCIVFSHWRSGHIHTLCWRVVNMLDCCSDFAEHIFYIYMSHVLHSFRKFWILNASGPRVLEKVVNMNSEREKKEFKVRDKRQLPSSVFLKLKLAVLSMEPDSYWVKLRQNSTSAEVGSLGVLAVSWPPGLRSNGPSGAPLHKAWWLLYSSSRVQMICTKHLYVKGVLTSFESKGKVREIEIPDHHIWVFNQDINILK